MNGDGATVIWSELLEATNGSLKITMVSSTCRTPHLAVHRLLPTIDLPLWRGSLIVLVAKRIRERSDRCALFYPYDSGHEGGRASPRGR